MKLCKDCVHLKDDDRMFGKPHQCFVLDGTVHPVTGTDTTCVEAGLMRLTLCGMDAKLWRRKVDDHPIS